MPFWAAYSFDSFVINSMTSSFQTDSSVQERGDGPCFGYDYTLKKIGAPKNQIWFFSLSTEGNRFRFSGKPKKFGFPDIQIKLVVQKTKTWLKNQKWFLNSKRHTSLKNPIRFFRKSKLVARISLLYLIGNLVWFFRKSSLVSHLFHYTIEPNSVIQKPSYIDFLSQSSIPRVH